MRYYWLRDKIVQSQFDIYWDRGHNNHADYFSKHHTAKYHREIRPQYVQDKMFALFQITPTHSELQGCVDTGVIHHLPV